MSKQLNVNLSFTADTEKAKAQIRELQSALDAISKAPLDVGQGNITKSIQEASVAAAQLKNHIQGAMNANTGTLDFSKLNASLKQGGTSLSEYAKKIAAIGPEGKKALATLATSINQAELPIKRSNAVLKEMATTLKNTARWQLSSSLLHSFMGALQSAYGYAQDLNKSLTDIRIVTGYGTDEMAKFAEAANKAARSLSTTTTEYTNASLIFYQQGLSTEEVEKRTAVTIKMANATGQSATQISDQLTAVWNNFYDGSKSLEYYADVMTALGAATASSTDEIAGGLEKFAAIGETIGLSYEYAASALATITSNTRQSEEVVGTALKTIFARIQGLELGDTLDDGVTLNKYSEALQKVGISIFEQNGELKKMDDILNEMGNKWNSLTNAQQNALAQTVAGVRQYTQLISLMENWNNGDDDSMMSNLDTAYTSSGTLNEQADTYAESWEAAQERVQAALEGVYQNLLKDEVFINALNSIEDIVSFIDKLIDSLGGLGGVLSTVSVLLMRTFSDEIAQKMRDMAYNMQMSTKYGREQAQQEKNRQAEEIGHILAAGEDGEGSDVGKAIANQYTEQRKLQQELMANQENMSQQEIEDAKVLLDLRRQIGDAIIEAEREKLAGKEKTQSGYTGAMEQLAQNALSVDEFGIDDEILEEFNGYKNAIKSSETAIVNLDDAASKYSKTQKNLAAANEKYDRVLKDSNSSEKEKADALKELKTASDSAQKAEENLSIAVHKAAEAIGEEKVSAEQADQAFEKIKNGLNGAEQEAEEAAEAMGVLKGSLKGISQEAQTGITDGLGIDKENVDQMVEGYRQMAHQTNVVAEKTENAASVQDNFKERLAASKVIMSDWAQRTVAFGQGLMSFVSIINSAKGAIETLTDPDASGWEKFSSVLMSFGSIVLMVSSMVSAMKKAFDGLTLAQIKEKAITILGTAAKIIDKAATEAAAKAALKKAAANKLEAESAEEVTEENIKKAISEKVDEEMTGKSIKSKGVLKNSLKDLGGSFKNLAGATKSWVSANAGAIGGVALIAAGIAVAVGAVAWGINQYNKYENAAEEAAKAAQLAADNYQKASEAYQQFTGNLNAYESAQKGLEGLTEGTEEYRQAVLKANEAAMELLNTYEGLTYTTDKNGLITIDQESLDKVKQEEQKKVTDAQNASLIARQAAESKKLEAESKQYQRDNLKSSQGGLIGAGNALAAGAAGAASGALVGAGLGALGAGVGALPGAIAGAIAGLGVGIVGAIKAGSAANEEEAALNKLAEVYEEEGNAAFASEESFRALLEEQGITDSALVESLVANRESTLELVSKIAENSAQTQALNEQLAATALQNNETVQNSEHRDDIIEIAGAKMGEERQKQLDAMEEEGWGTDGISKATKVNDQAEKIFEEYAKAAGLNLDDVELTNTKGTDKNREFVYKDAEGNEQTVSLDDMKEVVATSRASGVIDQTGTDLANIFDRLNDTQVATAKAAMTGDYDSLTMDQVQNGIDASKMGLSQEDLNKMGYANLEEYQAALDELTAEAQTAMEGIELTGLDPEVLGNLSVETAKNIQKTMEEINLGPLGEEGGKQYLEGLNTMVKDLDPKEQQEALAQLNNIDWSSWDAMEQADKIMKEFGVDIDTSSQEWKDFANQMRAANGAIPDFSQMVSTLSEVNGILNKLDFGSVISEEDYNKLMSYNDEWERYFILQADGTRKFIGNAEDMKKATQEDIQAQREQLEARKAAQAGFDKAGWGHSEGDAWVKADWANKKGSDTGTAQNLLNAGGATEDMLEMLGYDDEVLSGILDKAKNGTAEEIAAAQAQLEEMYQRMADFQNEDLDLETDKLDEMMASTATSVAELTGMLNDGQISAEAYDKQLTVLAQNAGSLEELQQIQAASLASGEGLDTGEYGEALVKLAENFSNCSEEIEEYNKALLSGDEKTIQAAQDALELSIGAGELAEKYDLNADEVEDYAKRLQKLNKDQKLSSSEATRLAAANMRLDRGLENLNGNLDDYKKALKSTNKGSAEWSKALSDLKTDLADVMNVADGDMLSDEFAEATLNSEDLAKAMDGDADAILRLRLAAADDIIAHLDIEGEDNIKTVQDNWQYLKDNMAAGVAAGNVDQSALIASFNEMIEAGNMTKEEIEAALSGLNVSANVKTEYVKQKVTVPTTITDQKRYITGYSDIDTNGDGETEKVANWRTETQTHAGEPVEVDGFVPKYTIEGTEGEGGITTAFVEAPAPKASYSSTTSGGAGGGGGGGGGSSSKPKTVEKDKRSDMVERYKEVNDQIDDITDAYDRANRAANRLWGADKIKKMQEANNALKTNLELTKQRIAEGEKYLEEDRAELEKAAQEAGITLTFDDKGNITNYTEQFNKLYDDYARIVDQANADGNVTEEEQEAIDKAKERYEKLDEYRQQYEDTRESIEDDLALAEEQLDEWQSNNFDILNITLEMKMEVNTDKLELVDYYIGKMEDDVYSMGEALALMTGDKLTTLLQQTQDYQDQYEALQTALKNGEINEQQYKEGIDEIQSGLLDSASALKELDDQTIAYYEETLSAAQEEINKYIEALEHLSSVLEHYSSILDLTTLTKKSAEYFDSMDKVLEGQAQTAKNTMEANKRTYEMFQAELVDKQQAYEDALKSGDEDLIRIRKEQYEAALAASNDAEEQYLSSVEAYAEKVNAILENNLNKFANALEDKLTGGTSFDQMNTSMERFVSLHEEYLTTTNKVYETTKLMNTAQKEIDKTSNTVAKNKMKQFIQETQNLQNQSKLSQFELDIQQAKYDLLVAEIALEEARDAKSQVRLQRDSEGNFGYVYTANQETVQNAEQAYLDAQNKLYNVGLEGANGYVEKYQQTMNEMYDTLADLAQQYRDGEFASEEEYQNAVKEATEYYYEKLDQYSYLHYQALQTDSAVATDYILSDSNLARTGISGNAISVGSAWRDTFLDISGFGEAAKAALEGQSWDVYYSNKIDLENMTGNAESWKEAVTQYITNVSEAFSSWKTDLAENVTPVIGDLETKVGDVVTASNTLRDALVGTEGTVGIIDKLQEEIDKVNGLTDEYIKLRDAILESIAAAEKSLEDIVEEEEEEVNPTTPEPETPAPTPPAVEADPPVEPVKDPEKDGDFKIGDKVKFISGYYYHDSSGSSPRGSRGPGKEVVVQNIKPGAPYPIAVKSSDSAYGWLKREQLEKFDTGGYTGEWEGPYGKIAMLHQKELVLKEKDTENFLASLEVMERILQMIDLQSTNLALQGNLSSPTFGMPVGEALEQNVHIEASFPGVSDRNEIEEAFKDLVNLASQYANRK